MTPVQEAVAEYIAHGWKLCRIQPGSKGPRDTAWNAPGHEIRVPDAFPLAWGVGLLHAFSGTMALDIDNYPVARLWLMERGVDLDELMSADDAVQIVSGKPNSAKLLYRCPPRQGKACAPYDSTDSAGKPRKAMALDFRCATAGENTQQDALPPTMHPGQGHPYEWRFGICGSWAALPELPTALDAIWAALCTPPATLPSPQTPVSTGAPPTKIEAWLRTQDPGMCRNDWVKVGMKLHAEFQGAPEGFELWQRWSAGSVKWDDAAREQIYPVWKGFKLEGRSLATMESELRSMPAAAEEFSAVQGEAPSVPMGAQAPAAVGELVESENPTQREIREKMQDYTVLLTSSKMAYFLLPGHPIPELNKAAGRAGMDFTYNQFNALWSPYLPLVLVGKAYVKPKASQLVDEAGWRTSAKCRAFRPGEKIIYGEDDGHTYLNGYRPINVTPIKPTPSEIAPLEWLLKRVLDERGNANGPSVFVRWLVRLYSYVLQNPGDKVMWAPLLYSKNPGTGKTTILQTLPEILFGAQYVHPMNHTVLKKEFAGAGLDKTWWVHIAEMHSDSGKVDARTIANKLKPWITDSTIQVEPKGVDAYSIKNYVQVTAASNDEDALFLEDGADDRRWLVGQILNSRLTPSEMSMLNPLFGKPHMRHPNHAGWVKHWFLERDIATFNPNEPPPYTRAKARVQEQSRSTWEDKVRLAFEDGAPPFDKDIVRPRELTEGLLTGQRVTLAQAAGLLHKIGAHQLKDTDTYRNLYCVRSFALWGMQPPAAVKEHIRSGQRPFVDDGSDLV